MYDAGLTAYLRFEAAGYLAALLLVPVALLLARRSLAGLGGARRVCVVSLRGMVLCGLILALASPQWVRHSDNRTAVFVVDRSESVPRELQQEAFQFVQAAAAGMRPNKDRIAVLSFAGSSVVEQLPGDRLRIDRLADMDRPHATDLAAGVRMALALLPPNSVGRVIVLSDGNENVGSAAREAEAGAAAGIPVDVVPIRYEHKSEIVVERLAAPAAARLDETITLNLVVRSQAPAAARVLLYHNETLLDLDPSSAQAGHPIVLESGYNRYPIAVSLRESGVHRFRAVVEPDRAEFDTILDNNEGRALTLVAGKPRVLILTEEAAADDPSANLLAQALRQAQIECDIVSLGDFAPDSGALLGYSAVMLSNVSAMALGEGGQRALASYVRDLGGGLIALGGDRAFSMGGYHRTPLEEVLPVETARDRLKLLSLGMVIVIDRSGSMMGERLHMARAAAIGAVQLLSARDRVGVIAFDHEPEWIVPLTRCENKSAIEARIAGIGAGGGTVMYPAIEQAAAALAHANTNLRHIIVLTDGHSVPGDFDGLAQRCADAGISITTVAVGRGADEALLARIAQRSGGRFYVTYSARPLPQIFARETALVGRSGMVERAFAPTLQTGLDEQILRGFDQADIPPLRGYVVAAARPLARTPLVHITDDGADPILAYWQAGLGRTVAFTSGMWSRWGPEWIEWPGFGKLWAQCVRYAARPESSQDFRVTTAVEGSQARIIVEADGLPARLLGSVSLVGQVVDPQYEAHELRLEQAGPGRFEAVFPAERRGAYLASMAYRIGAGEQARVGSIQAGVAISHSPEHSTVRHDEAVLTSLARQTDGRVLRPDQPLAVFEPWSIPPIEMRQPIWEDLVRLVVLLFLLDVAVRRLAVHPIHALRRLRAFLGEMAGTPAPAGASQTVAALRGARERAREGLSPRAAAPDATSGDVVGDPDGAAEDDLSRALRGDGDMRRPVVKSPDGPRRGGDDEYAARLLRAKRRARGERD